MRMKVTVVKPFRHGLRVFDVGEVGEIVEVDCPLIFQGKPVYAFYVRFPGYPPIGIRKDEIKEAG